MVIYLICKDCNGYYKLNKNENIDDFDCCSLCNGSLEYLELVDSPPKTKRQKEDELIKKQALASYEREKIDQEIDEWEEILEDAHKNMRKTSRRTKRNMRFF